MAEEVLVSLPLLPTLISGGEDLVHRLTQDGYPPRAAFWIQENTAPSWKENTAPSWKLVIASDDFLSDYSFKVHKRILDRAPQTPGQYWPALIRIEDSNHPLVTAVRSAIKGAYGRAHVGWATVNLWSTVVEPSQIYAYVV